MKQVIFRISQLESLYKAYSFFCEQKRVPVIFGSKEDFQFAKDNFLIILLSQLYSLFDKSGLDLQKVKNPDNLLKEIINDWKGIKKEITRIRHNLGFHGANKIEGTQNATSSFSELGEDGLKIALALFHKLKRWKNMKLSDKR